jgi:ribose transport system substrate-binding protein
MKKLIFAMTVLAMLGPAATAAEKPKEAKKPVYVLVPKSVVHPYWARVRKGMEKAAKEMGVKAIFDGPPNNDLARQIEIIEGYITRRVAGIAISPNDARGIEEVIRRAVRRDIQVITFDSDAPASERTMYIGTVNREAGRAAGRALVEAMGGKGTVAVLHGSLTALNLRERLDGFRDEIRKAPDMKIVAMEENRDDAALALSQAENILQRYPKLGGFFGTSVTGAPAAAAALRSKGMLGKVKVVGFDLDKDNLKAVQKGYIYAIIEQRPALMGELALKWLDKLHHGIRPEKSVLDTGVEVVTKANAAKAAEMLK